MYFEQLSFDDLMQEEKLPSKEFSRPASGRRYSRQGRFRGAENSDDHQGRGLPFYPFYRTDSGGCYSYEEGLDDLERLRQQAEKNRRQYETIEPKNLERRITVKYPPLCPNGGTLWAQVGIFQGMLFWKESMTYQFLQQCKNEKELNREYEKHKKQILEEFGGSAVIVEGSIR